MRLATLRTPDGTRAARVDGASDGATDGASDGATVVELAAPDVGALLAAPNWRELAAAGDGARHPFAGAELAPVVPRPGKIFCVGLNYRTHILEMGRELPEYPTLFAKFAEALVGPADPVVLAPESSAVDWEAELAVVIGTRVRRADTAAAEAAIAGFAVLNDVTMRDWQYRSVQWLQGKTFEATTPFGPVLVTPDELPGGVRPALALRCAVDGETVQSADTADLVFDPVTLVEYLSRIVTLNPGDVIATGTPGGVGHARKPPRYLTEGTVLVTEIDWLGRLENVATAAAEHPVPAVPV
ncbi:MAG TPA: fumarylacetoacetate hydrolase family protein [Pseudonocardia sp.]|nr:fumarylacetoacetate hydrolase family protein [Pseudonocardia sp.]